MSCVGTQLIKLVAASRKERSARRKPVYVTRSIDSKHHHGTQGNSVKVLGCFVVIGMQRLGKVLGKEALVGIETQRPKSVLSSLGISQRKHVLSWLKPLEKIQCVFLAVPGKYVFANKCTSVRIGAD
jgi:hypothetical protein